CMANDAEPADTFQVRPLDQSRLVKKLGQLPEPVIRGDRSRGSRVRESLTFARCSPVRGCLSPRTLLAPSLRYRIGPVTDPVLEQLSHDGGMALQALIEVADNPRMHERLLADMKIGRDDGLFGFEFRLSAKGGHSKRRSSYTKS
ncbi:MAG: hypothetical protein ACREBC_12500, partial [Pyrinomonadaceae bacterium]